MTRLSCKMAGLLVAVVAVCGCGGQENSDNMITDGRPVEGPGGGGAPAPGGGGPAGPGGGGGQEEAAADPGSTRAIMIKIGRGPTALSTVLGNELKSETPEWATIQPQTKEFAQLAALVSQNDPPRGSEESWAKLSKAFGESATELDKAAQAKDRAAALTAHGKLAAACMECHREHRTMGPPPAGKGGTGGGMGGAPFGPPSNYPGAAGKGRTGPFGGGPPAGGTNAPGGAGAGTPAPGGSTAGEKGAGAPAKK